MAGEKVVLFNDTYSATDRARIQLLLQLAASIFGYNPSHISNTPGVKPSDYEGDGSPFGYYIKAMDGQFYIQPVIWDNDLGQWDDFGGVTVTKTALDNRLTALEQSIDAEQYIKSEPDGIAGANRVTNIIYMTQADYDALDPKPANVMVAILPEGE